MKKQKLFFFVFLLVCEHHLIANPESPTVVHGDVQFQGLNTSSMIIEASDRSIIHWDSFSIGSTEITQFIQPSIDSAVLNRVTGDQMSSLMGTLQANGQIYLINPNGILVGDQGVIDVGSLVASSFDLQDSAFLDSQDFSLEGESLEPISNQGTIQTRNGDLVIVAHRVDNQGTLSAKEGSAWVVAGHEILVGISGKNFLYVRPQLPGDGVMNEGSIEALRVSLNSCSSPFSLGIQNKGSVDAFQVEEKNGELYLTCKGGNIDNLGTLHGHDVFIQGDGGHIKNEHLIEADENFYLQARTDSSLLADQKAVFNYGTLKGNKIHINVPKFKNSGSLLAQEEISIFTPGVYMETQEGKVSVNGGTIEILAGRYFTSGTVSAKGPTGGSIKIQAESFASTASHFNASGGEVGGTIEIHATSMKEPLHLNPHATLDVSGREQGGTIELSSSLAIDVQPVLKYSGKTQGSFKTSSKEPSSSIEMSLHKNQLRLIQDEALQPIDLLDPNPSEASNFWTLYKASQRSDSFYETIEMQLAANIITCPPTPLEMIDPNQTGINSTFGNTLIVLSNGNVVVTKVGDNFGGTNAGAVYLYNGNTAALTSALIASTAGSQISSGGITLLDNACYVIASPSWNNGTFANVGAVTFATGIGISGVVSASNSLVGSSLNDQVGSGNATIGDVISGVTALTNGNYVVSSPSWNGVVSSGGAVTLCNGVIGTVGLVTTSNSLYGTTANDQVGSNLILPSIAALTNGNYVVASSQWNNGAAIKVGAVTWADGTLGIVGPVTTSNSLHGGATNDQAGSDGIVPLTNGNYVVCSSLWDNPGGAVDVGAATWADGTTGLVGLITTSNSLFGSTGGDVVGRGGFDSSNHVSFAGAQALTNGNYVVKSPNWANGSNAFAGAATFGNGTTGITGAVTATNSLVGSRFEDRVSNGGGNSILTAFGVVPLTNGNYVVVSPTWEVSVLAGKGAVTFGNGTTGVTGIVSSSNSLVGTTTDEGVGAPEVIALANGNYVVLTGNFSGDFFDGGAATFSNGTTGISGPVTTGNSFFGDGLTNTLDLYLVALTNGNYVIPSGFATFANGITGIVGTANDSNSLDSNPNFMLPLSNGNYAVISTILSSDSMGTITVGSGTTGITGEVTADNSVLGGTSNDQIGSGYSFPGETPVITYNTEVGDQFMVLSPNFTNGFETNAGAVTFLSTTDGSFCDGSFGIVSASNSFVGANANSGLSNMQPGNATLEPSNVGFGIAVVQFTSYLDQTRVFTFGKFAITPPSPPSPTPSPSSLTPTVPAKTFSYFTNAFAQAFTDWEPVHMNFVGYSIYPPRDTWNGLDFFYDSLLVETEGFD